MTDGQGVNREEFVGRVRSALGRGYTPGHAPRPPAVDDAVARVVGEDDDLVGRFAERATEIGMSVRRCGAADLFGVLSEVLDEVGAKRVTLAVDALPQAEALADVVRGHGVAIVDWRGDRSMAASYAIDAGITDVACAIAEAGSLVRHSDADHGRSLSLVPPVHIAIVRASDVVADLLDYMRKIGGAPGDLPATACIITGPSKTADIEGVLVTGVHGPGQVIILLVADA
jgi:L-lactate dehydrogenase complex protein LldG